MKKMSSALLALLGRDEPHVGPTVVMEMVSALVCGTAFAGFVVVVVVGDDVVVAPAAVVVVVGAAVVEVVVAVFTAEPCVCVRRCMASCTFWLTAFCCAWASRLSR